MELAKAFALLPNSLPVQRSVLLRALDDNSEGAVQYAVVGVGKLRIGSALPRLVELLTDENRAVRLAVAAALSNYGSEARPYLPLLHSALESEGDPTVRKVLEATVVRVDR